MDHGRWASTLSRRPLGSSTKKRRTPPRLAVQGCPSLVAGSGPESWGLVGEAWPRTRPTDPEAEPLEDPERFTPEPDVRIRRDRVDDSAEQRQGRTRRFGPMPMSLPAPPQIWRTSTGLPVLGRMRLRLRLVKIVPHGRRCPKRDGGSAGTTPRVHPLGTTSRPSVGQRRFSSTGVVPRPRDDAETAQAESGSRIITADACSGRMASPDPCDLR